MNIFTSCRDYCNFTKYQIYGTWNICKHFIYLWNISITSITIKFKTSELLGIGVYGYEE